MVFGNVMASSKKSEPMPAASTCQGNDYDPFLDDDEDLP